MEDFKIAISENKIYPRTGDIQTVYLKADKGKVVMWQFKVLNGKFSLIAKKLFGYIIYMVLLWMILKCRKEIK